MKFLIVYSTIEGQTRKIAQFMQNVLKDEGHQVVIADAADEPPAPTGFDAFLIGASIHIHKYQSTVTHYVTHYKDLLNEMPGAFFSVCLAVASDLDDEHREAQSITNAFLEQTGWKPLMTMQVAGALKYTQYDFFKRILMRMIAKREGGGTDTSKDYEYTDWEAVKNFVNGFAIKAAEDISSEKTSSARPWPFITAKQRSPF